MGERSMREAKCSCCGAQMISSLEEEAGVKFYMYHCPKCMELKFIAIQETQEKVVFS